MLYASRFVHKVAPSAKDVGPAVALELPDLTDRKTLGAALRRAGISERIGSFRLEDGKIVIFPQKSIWHAIVLTPKG